MYVSMDVCIYVRISMYACTYVHMYAHMYV